MRKGTIKWFDAVRGYGFIAPFDASSGDLFVHDSDVRGDRALERGDLVQFEVEQAPRGPKARCVSVVEE
jgi:CspA family cold shock protein